MVNVAADSATAASARHRRARSARRACLRRARPRAFVTASSMPVVPICARTDAVDRAPPTVNARVSSERRAVRPCQPCRASDAVDSTTCLFPSLAPWSDRVAQADDDKVVAVALFAASAASVPHVTITSTLSHSSHSPYGKADSRTSRQRGAGALTSRARTTCRPGLTPYLFGSEYEPTQSFSLTEPAIWPTKVTLPEIPWKRPVPLANSPDPLCAPLVLDCVPAI